MSVCAMMAKIRGSTVSPVMAGLPAFQAERRPADNRHKHFIRLFVNRVRYCDEMGDCVAIVNHANEPYTRGDILQSFSFVHFVLYIGDSAFISHRCSDSAGGDVRGAPVQASHEPCIVYGPHAKATVVNDDPAAVNEGFTRGS